MEDAERGETSRRVSRLCRVFAAARRRLRERCRLWHRLHSATEPSREAGMATPKALIISDVWLPCKCADTSQYLNVRCPGRADHRPWETYPLYSGSIIWAAAEYHRHVLESGMLDHES